MGRKFCITEEQYKRVMKEGILPTGKFTVQAKTDGISDDPTKAVEQTKKDLEKIVPNADKNFQVAANNPKSPNTQIVSNNNQTQNNGNSMSESKIITKKQLQENRLKVLKKDSNLYTVKDFIKKFQ